MSVFVPKVISLSRSLAERQLSLMVKVIPSPDWFVGVDSFSLCEGGQWKQEVTLDLQPFDAGTDSGFTFSSPTYPTVPVENVTRVSQASPCASRWVPARPVERGCRCTLWGGSPPVAPRSPHVYLRQR